MGRIEHRFVRGIRAQTELQYEVQGKQRLVHHALPLTQSVIDSACGLISTLQAAMILLGIPRLLRPGLNPTQDLWLCEVEYGVASRGDFGGAKAAQKVGWWRQRRKHKRRQG